MTDVRSHAVDLSQDLAAVRSHRAPARVSRRGLLGLATLAAVPATGVVAVRTRGVAPDPAATTAAPGGPDVPVAGSPTAPPAPAPIVKGGGPVPNVPGKVLLGSYLGLDGMSPSAALRLRAEQLGRPQRIVHLFYAWTDSLPDRIPYLPDRAYPMISWRGRAHRPILDGEHDRLIARNARRLRRLGRPVLLRWGWEMNGDWYPWGGARNDNNPEGYARCWRRLQDIFADEGADNVSWVWSPNWNSSPDAGWNTMARYYPGDEHVDWIGVSGYDLHRETPDTLFEPIYRAYATRKPLMISEVGAVDRGGSTKADWIERFAAWCRQHPAVGAVTWFDTDTHPGYRENWRIDTDSRSLAAYRAMARDPHFRA
ncbi:MAG TPA: glycosyl hydrolase [Actinoplanes sp.]|nr:glycosyl hydrolase [Actinoplanes sp.]